jgi:hypothetical protein
MDQDQRCTYDRKVAGYGSLGNGCGLIRSLNLADDCGFSCFHTIDEKFVGKAISI